MAKILLSDDNELMFEDSIDRAYKMGIELNCVTNWEDAEIELLNNWNQYDGLILDGKGKLNEAVSGSDVTHLHRALAWLNQKYGMGQLMPTVIYSAYIGPEKGKLEEHIDTNQPFILDVFSKDVSIDHVIRRIKNYSSSLPENRLKLQYQDIFKLFDDKRLPKEMQPIMLEILSGLSVVAVEKTDYNKIRDIIESMLKMANGIDNGFIPNIILNPSQNNRPNLKHSELYLTGREVKIGSVILPKSSSIMPEHVGWIYGSIVNCCQIFSHNSSQKHYNYAYKSAVFGLMEVLMWYKDYLTSKYKI